MEYRHRPHPLAIDHIADMIFDYIGPSFLLTARLIDRTWSSAVSHKLHRDGWRIHLTSDRLDEYLRLLQATAVDRERLFRKNQADPTVFDWLPGPELSLHLRVTPDSRGSVELETALKISRYPDSPRIVYLELEYADSFSNRRPFVYQGNRVEKLLAALGPSLRQLSIRLLGEDGSNLPWVWNSLPQQLNSLLPALEDVQLRYGYNTKTIELVNLIIGNILPTACNLRRLQLELNDRNHKWEPPSPVDLSTTLWNSHRFCANLLELDINFGAGSPKLPELNGKTAQLCKLRSLRVVGAQLEELVIFVHSQCPVLETLEIVDGSGSGIRSPDVQEMRLTSITALGYHRDHVQWPISYDTENGVNLVVYRLGFLDLMDRCPNLRDVSTHLSTWIQLANDFIDMGGNSGHGLDERANAGVFLPSRFQLDCPGVETLRVTAPLKSNPQFPDFHLESFSSRVRLHTICFLIANFFPRLTKLVVDLGTYFPSAEVHSTVDYVLGIAFGIPTLKQVIVENVYKPWPWRPTWLRLPRGHEQELQRRDISNLEMFKICSVPKSFGRLMGQERLQQGTEQQDEDVPAPQFDPAPFFSIVPSSCPNLVVQIEANLLLNYSRPTPDPWYRTPPRGADGQPPPPIYPFRPYERLAQRLRSQTNPRVVLI